MMQVIINYYQILAKRNALSLTNYTQEKKNSIAGVFYADRVKDEINKAESTEKLYFHEIFRLMGTNPLEMKGGESNCCYERRNFKK